MFRRRGRRQQLNQNNPMMVRGLRLHLSILTVVAIAGLPLTTARAQSTSLANLANSATDSIPPRAEAGNDDMALRARTRARASLWLLSTRRLLPASPDASQASFAPLVWEFEPGCGWVASSLDELLLAGSQSITTNLFIHGNDNTAQDAAEIGAALHRQLLVDARPPVPQQFVTYWATVRELALRPVGCTCWEAERWPVCESRIQTPRRRTAFMPCC